MELKLKHLTSYIPYKVNIFDISNGIQTFEACYEFKTSNINRVLNTMKETEKIVLTPLSEYKSFPEIIDEMSEYEIQMIDENPDMVNRLPYDVIELMFKNHIDIFGLIKNELAIDKNTIAQWDGVSSISPNYYELVEKMKKYNK